MLKEYVRRMTSKGQVTVPAEVRRKLGLKPGETIIFRIVGDQVELDRSPMSLDEAFGSVPPLNAPVNFEAQGREAWEEHAQKVVQEMRED